VGFDYAAVLGTNSGRAFIDCNAGCKLAVGELESSVRRKEAIKLLNENLKLDKNRFFVPLLRLV
jgi:hypothetical protein